MSHRPEQLAASIRRGVQEIISRGLQDPRIGGMITVTSVRVTDDLQEAFVSISVLPAEKQELTFHGLKAASRHIRHELSDLIEIRQMPEIVFRLDETLKKEAAVLRDIDRARRELEDKSHGTDSGPPTSPWKRSP